MDRERLGRDSAFGMTACQLQNLIDPRGSRIAAAPLRWSGISGGEGGIRTLGTGVSPYNGLANAARPLPIARNQSDTITSDVPSRAESGCSATVYAPQYAPHPAELAQGSDNRRPHLISCLIGELRAHPSYIQHKLSVDASRFSALAQRGDLAFADPIVITRDRIVIDGYARLELAKRTGRRMLDCIAYDLSPEEALRELIRTHCSLRGLTDFVRIELALELEPYFREKALMHQQAGGQGKALSKLTTAQRVDTRREVARIAGVGTGNVRKVKNVLTHACSSLLQAARTKEVSINLADKWSSEPAVKQQEHLRLFRTERGIQKKARTLAADIARLTGNSQVIEQTDLASFLNQLPENTADLATAVGSVEVAVVNAPGRRVFVTEELMDSLRQLRQEVCAR